MEWLQQLCCTMYVPVITRNVMLRNFGPPYLLILCSYHIFPSTIHPVDHFHSNIFAVDNPIWRVVFLCPKCYLWSFPPTAYSQLIVVYAVGVGFEQIWPLGHHDICPMQLLSNSSDHNSEWCRIVVCRQLQFL